MTALPIESALPELRRQLNERGSAVLVAQPGAGKTTRVPLALLDAPWLAGRRILMLEPRRLAARSAARFMASLFGEEVGQTVGYRVRMDTRVGPKTRIEVVTEGVLTRLLQADPGLDGVGAVLFDEFHERSLHADLGLALCLQCRALFRDDLRLLVMSATLDAAPVAELLGGAPVIESGGRVFPVETRYLPDKPEGRLEETVARAIRRALAEEAEGDLLVFLPGTGEIRRVEALLADRLQTDRGRIRILPLHGNLPQDAQDRAIAPSEPGVRKIVLSTSIAETSLTIEGTRIVVDSGWMRVPKFSPQTGMTRLETVRVSLASADQRRGRAGRLGPGVCYRLWTETEERTFAPHGTPEIAEADLAPLALELAAWGAADPGELRWLDEPPAAAYRQARELLTQFGALAPSGAITPHGRRMAELGMHPRLAHMALRAVPLGLGPAACALAALLSERDAFRRVSSAPSPVAADLRLRLEALLRHGRSGATGEAAPAYSGMTADASALRRAAAAAADWRRALGLSGEGGREPDVDACGLLLALAYPDRIGQNRGGGRFLLSSGRGAAFAETQTLSSAPYIVAAELDDHGAESRIALAAPVDVRELERTFPERFAEESIVEWDRSTQSVRARRRKRLGAIAVTDVPLSKPGGEETIRALLDGLAVEGIGMLPWTGAARRLQQRVLFLRRHDADWPDWSDEALERTAEEWLAPHVAGIRSRAELQSLNLVSVLEAALPWEKRRRLDEWAPTHLTVPSGSRLPVDYADPEAPSLSARLQELFGWTETPRIGGGRVPVTIRLLSPAQRPVQVTRDLANFWRETYFEVKKDLKGRYPKHYWPDDPMSAVPTNRVKPKP
ncbi:ATP-dependent helicase HrpB [Paenibacillus flagellatus]|uniref:ATP-dependent helicase HrpB n=1 Tax=Paenibacillus flagellatus TaxID=2211139 RepID=A0A2V5K8E6_9BACL|nr:ATP-dependent helicase HrpB [Paenibacillus flagellatus]PYI55785.1 ATP-dependent helicase HrpB [Paenibacillus flagellatus]